MELEYFKSEATNNFFISLILMNRNPNLERNMATAVALMNGDSEYSIENCFEYIWIDHSLFNASSSMAMTRKLVFFAKRKLKITTLFLFLMVDSRFYVKADSTFTIFGRYVLVIK